jgi:hypothetical protein
MRRLIEKIYNFFDKLEDRVRAWFSRYPIVYGIVGGIAIVIFWRGVWHTADSFNVNAPFSIFASVIILLITGLFASSFIGDQIILSGLKREKKLTEHTESEVESEEEVLLDIRNEVRHLEKEIEELKGDK